ncbi:MAG: Jag N-terminal domain-containing protein [Campylobacterales bacterium]
MSKKFSAKNLEDAYALAAKELKCSILDLECEVLQHPSSGFLGLFGRKEAIILATYPTKPMAKDSEAIEEAQKPKAPLKEESKEYRGSKKQVERPRKEETKKAHIKQPTTSEVKYSHSEKGIIDSFYSQKEGEKVDIIEEIKEDINKLFSKTCFDLAPIKVERYDENTIYVEFSGDDAALLIGKEGYRYKALSYMLFNWINSKYNLMIRLEIAEFLQNQEEMIRNYLKPLISNIKKDGRGQTKPLDGVLVHIALKQLRDVFPNKYVAIKVNHDGDRFVVVNDFYSQQKQ